MAIFQKVGFVLLNVCDPASLVSLLSPQKRLLQNSHFPGKGQVCDDLNPKSRVFNTSSLFMNKL